MKVFFVLLIVGLLIGTCGILLYDKTEEKITEEKIELNYFQGPIPIGHDSKHFRNTGETIEEVIV